MNKLDALYYMYTENVTESTLVRMSLTVRLSNYFPRNPSFCITFQKNISHDQLLDKIDSSRPWPVFNEVKVLCGVLFCCTGSAVGSLFP